jgi:tetratricopeptide (TPR) repeat protein
MDRPHPYPLRAAVAAIAVGFTICAAAAERVEHVSTQTEFSPAAAGPSSSVDIEAALARVDAARSRADADPLALEDALTALGDAFLNASQYATAEAAYAEALRLAEQHGGFDGERLLTPLLGLGNALAGSGRHEEAVPRLQRAVAIARVQYGLFDLHQQDMLKTLATSLTAVGRVPEAQDLMIYRARVAEKTYGEESPEVIPARCDLGDWFAEVGMSPEARMVFQVALNIVESKLNDPVIVEPLRGIARTYMRRHSYPESALRPREAPPFYQFATVGPPPPFRFDAMGKPIVEARVLNREGEYALQRALRVLEADPRASTHTRIETLIQMGDWYQIKKSPREALPHYQRASQLIRTAPGLSGSAATALDFPVRVSYPTPEIVANVLALPPEETQSHYVQIEFTVAADGSVPDARVVDHDTRDRYADDILDAMRAARFRPKFVDGEAVATPAITYREVFWTAKSRE